MPDDRWLDTTRAASYISVRPDALPKLVRAGRIPAPDYTLGPRKPRWDRLALDARFEGGIASTDADQIVAAAVQSVLTERRNARGPGKARGRHA